MSSTLPKEKKAPDDIPSDTMDGSDAQAFLETQLNYARQAKDIEVMTRQDRNGQLPLHLALQDNHASLGAIKLLANGSPNALRVSDHQGLIPLHFACQHGTVDAVTYLVEFAASCLDICDASNHFPIHHACRWGNCSIVTYLLKKSIASVCERNVDGKLPIELLFGSNGNQGSTEYTEAIWRLLKAYPEILG